MTHIIKVIVNGNPYIVEVGEADADAVATPSGVGSVQVRVNGRIYQVAVERIDRGRPEDQMGLDVSHDLPPEVATPVEETPWDVQVEAGRAGVFSPGAVTAPMPGNISNISASVGDAVSRDQVLCTLEAMKMQNAIRSPRDGVIATVNVRSGQAVSYGDVLFVFE